MRLQRLLLVGLLFGLAGCGPRTIASMLHPLKYNVITVMDMTADGLSTRQTVVSHCKVIDETDSLAKTSQTTLTGERHWLKRPDGSLWIMGLLKPCRWNGKAPQTLGFRPIRQGLFGRDRFYSLADSLTYRFDNAQAPTRLDTFETQALFEGEVEGLSVQAQLAPGGEAPTDSLTAAFPYLAQVRAAAAADRLNGKHNDRLQQHHTLVGYFQGYWADARQLVGTACDTPDPKAAGPVLLQEGAECHLNNRCPAEAQRRVHCYEPLGGLRPRVEANFRLLRFSLSNLDQAFVATTWPSDKLREAGAPGDWGPYAAQWTPKICIDSLCLQTALISFPRVYYPARNILVEFRPIAHRPSDSVFLARPGTPPSGAE